MSGEDVVALVERAELELAAGDIAAATDKLRAVASMLTDTDERPRTLGRALWLAALISLASGRLAEFVEQASGAIESLRAGGDQEGAARATRLYDEIARRVDSDLTVQAGGALGFLAVLEANLERVIERAEIDGPWDEVDRDRAQLAQLARVPTAEGRGQPFSTLFTRLGLDPIDAVALALLVPLATSASLRARALALVGDDGRLPGVPAGIIAGLGFARRAAQEELARRLAPGAKLRERGIVEVLVPGAPERERIELAASVVWFLHGAAIEDMPRGAGVSVVRSAAQSIPVDPLLARAAADVVRWAGGTPSVLVLSGRRGAGKSTVVAAGAADTGRALIAVDADAIAWEAWTGVLAGAARDALCADAVLYLRCDRDLPSVREISKIAGLRLAIGVDPGDAGPFLDGLRGVRADVVPLELAPLDESELVGAWERALDAHGISKLDARELGPLVRPGMVIGDIVDAVTECAARAQVSGASLDVPVLAAVVTERAMRELDVLAEPIELREAGDLGGNVGALDAAARDLRRSHAAVDDWGVATVDSVTVVRGAIAIVGGSPRQRLAAAARVAAQLSLRLYRLDMADLVAQPVATARAHLGALAQAAGRAGVLVYLASAEVLRKLAPGPIPFAVGEVLRAPGTGFVVGADRPSSLPSPVRSRVASTVELAAAEEGAA